MAHISQYRFCKYVQFRFPKYFKDTKVFDGGSLDVNGNNRIFFKDSFYVGCDIGEGKNVDVVSKIHQYTGEDNYFDVIITTECLEHDEHYILSIQNMIRMLKSKGLFIITCATTNRPEHGTINTDGQFSCPLLETDYYKNLTEEDIKKAFAIPLDDIFSSHEFIINTKDCDIYFWGIKH